MLLFRVSVDLDMAIRCSVLCVSREPLSKGCLSCYTGMNRQLSLQEIQKREKEEAEKEKAANLVKQQQLLEQQSQQQQGQLKWAAPKNNR